MQDMGVAETSGAKLPDSIGPYKIISRLGEGGMGTVYRAVHREDPKTEVALKVILAGLTEDEDAEKRFLREAKILKELRHPNIVNLLDVGTAGDRKYYSMELLDGVPLSAYRGKPYYETVPLLYQVLRGMEYLAGKSIVHRDLSPSNIMVSRTESGPLCKVLDFGIAKNLEGEGTLDSFTKTGLVMGKPAYWSPEQLGSLGPGQTLDWLSDVYALGVIFYLVLSGKLPITADSPFSFATKHLSERPDPVVAPPNNPPLPAELVQMVERMLEKKRENRPQSYEEMCAVLVRSAPDMFPEEARTRTAQTSPWGVTSASSVGTKTTGIMAAGVAAGTATQITDPGVQTSATGQLAGTAVTNQLTGATAAVPGVTTEAVVKQGFPLVPFLAGIVAAGAVFAGAGYYLTRDRVESTPVIPATPAVSVVPTPPPPAEGMGKLSLSAFPWARVIVVKNSATGAVFPIPADLATPAVLELPPGTYLIDLVSGVGTERRQISVNVLTGQVAEHNETFASPQDLAAQLQ
ncbi:MAG: Serine/threonine-protein kinase PknD [Thermoanaerobaculia bacterium]|nr:Serine/threonine-protein kinase PknD [Thermoanaerobaculia bacterium]